MSAVPRALTISSSMRLATISLTALLLFGIATHEHVPLTLKSGL